MALFIRKFKRNIFRRRKTQRKYLWFDGELKMVEDFAENREELL